MLWLVIVGSLALASYLWMRIDEARKAADQKRGGAGKAKAGSVSADAPRRA